MGTNSPVSSAYFIPKRPRFFLPGSRRRPFSSGTTATEFLKNFWNWFLPRFSASLSALLPSGAILTRKPLMMPVPVVSPLKVVVPVSDIGRSCRGGWVAGAAGRVCGAVGWGAGCAGRGAEAACLGCGAAWLGAGPGSFSRASRWSSVSKAKPPWTGCAGAVEMPTLRKISSTWWSVTLSRSPACACCIFRSSRIRSTESLVRLLGMVIPLCKRMNFVFTSSQFVCASHHSTGCRRRR